MLKPNRLVAMATAGKLSETARPDHRNGCGAGPHRTPISAAAPDDLLASLTNGLRRLCELAFAPNGQVHELASKAMRRWSETADLDIESSVSPNQIRDRDSDAVRLLTAIVLYLELCRRESTASTTGVLETAALSRLITACQGRVPPEAVARCPALRRFLNHDQTARPSTGRAKQIAAA